MTFNTGNPVGSVDPRDLYDNAKNADIAVNTQDPTWTDRLGVERKSWAGIEQGVSDALSRLGYQVKGDYAADLLIENYGEVFRKDGEFYRAKAETTLPYSLNGDWAVDAPKFVSVGDAVLRQELAGADGGELVNVGGRSVSDKFSDQPLSIIDAGAPVDGVSDCGPALAAALAQSSRIYFPENANGYAFKSQINVVLTSDTVIDFNGQTLTFEGGRIILRGQTILSGVLPQTLKPRYSKQWVLASAAGVQPGDLLYVNTAIQPSPDWADTKKDLVRISSVSGETLTLDAGLNFAYSTGDSGIYADVYRPVTLEIKRPVVKLIAADSDTTPYVCFDLWALRDVIVRNPEIIGQRPFDRANNIYRVGLQFYKCWGVTVENPVYDSMSYPAGAYGGTRNVREVNVRSRYCHHAHLDMGDWASDYKCVGLDSQDAYQAVNSHPAFRVEVHSFHAANDYGISNMRCFGGGLFNGVIETSGGDDLELSQYQSNPVAAGYEYLYADADFTLDGVDYVAPNRVVKPVVEVRNGRRVYVTRTKAPSFGVSAAAKGSVTDLVFGPGNRFGTLATATPPVINLRSAARAHVPPRIDSYLDGTVRHIDLRRQLADQGGDIVRAYGAIARSLSGEPAVVPVRVHVNCIAGMDQVNDVIGKIKLFSTVKHQNTGLFATLEKTFNFYMKVSATSLVEFPTTSIQATGASGQANESLTLGISNVSFAGESQLGVAEDHYVQFDVSLASGRTSPSYSLSYELELICS
ncbi:hypothetical protein [Pelagibacterium sp.]|uniref:hypothetical protein n=1 Tax=Pelagibacterium sp. TaxID=1967288 RepID=UPI003A953913